MVSGAQERGSLSLAAIGYGESSYKAMLNKEELTGERGKMQKHRG